MGAIPAQLAEGLEIRTGAPVATIGPHAVSIESGELIRSRAVVVATSGLLDEPASGWNGVTCVHFDAPATPIPGPWLVVNGEGGPVNNLSVPSEVAPGYAPPGRSLVAVSVLGGRRARSRRGRAAVARLVRSSRHGLAASTLAQHPARVARVPGGSALHAARPPRGRPLCVRRPSRAPVAERCDGVRAASRRSGSRRPRLANPPGPPRRRRAPEPARRGRFRHTRRSPTKEVVPDDCHRFLRTASRTARRVARAPLSFRTPDGPRPLARSSARRFHVSEDERE